MGAGGGGERGGVAGGGAGVFGAGIDAAVCGGAAASGGGDLGQCDGRVGGAGGGGGAFWGGGGGVCGGVALLFAEGVCGLAVHDVYDGAWGGAGECEGRAVIAAATGAEEYAILISTKEYKKERVRYFTPEVEEWERAMAIKRGYWQSRGSQDRVWLLNDSGVGTWPSSWIQHSNCGGGE